MAKIARYRKDKLRVIERCPAPINFGDHKMLGTTTLSAEDDAHRRKLHGYGMNDAQIARRIGVAKYTIRRWRAENGLIANARQAGQPTPRKDNDERLALYRLGKSDGQIAKIIGRDRSSVSEWRRNLELPARENYGPPPIGRVVIATEADDRRMSLYRRGWTDSKIAADVGLTASGILDWRRRRGLPANERERDWDRPATTIVSLDADLGEGGFNRHALIADDAAAEWLEDNGATRW